MTKQQHKRFPRLRDDIWQGVPRLDLSKIKDPAWVIDFFLARASTQLVFGAAGTWKTTTMLTAGWAVSQGKPFLGMKTRQRPVLYLDYENPDHVAKRMCQDLKIDPSSPAFAIWNRSDTPTPRPKDDELEDFVKHCKKVTGHAPWIIFDSWTSLLRAGDSGDKIGEATHIFRAIRHLCDMGATCTIIDHTGKSKRKDPIGTSAKMTQMDTSHYLKQQSEEMLQGSNSKRTIVRVESFLKRYAPQDVGTFSFEVDSALDEKLNWHVISIIATKDRDVLKQENEIEGLKRLIKSNPTLGQEDLAEAAAVKENKIMSRDRARQLLQFGIGKSWVAITKGKSHKQVFRVLKSVK